MLCGVKNCIFSHILREKGHTNVVHLKMHVLLAKLFSVVINCALDNILLPCILELPTICATKQTDCARSCSVGF